MKIAREIETHGVKEIVLTGVNIGDFGQGKDETFLQLITEMDKIKNIDRNIIVANSYSDISMLLKP